MIILPAKHTKELFEIVSKKNIKPELYNQTLIRNDDNYQHHSDPIQFNTSPVRSQALHPNPQAFYHPKKIIIDSYDVVPLRKHLESTIRNIQWEEAMVTTAKLLQILLFHKEQDNTITLHSGALKQFKEVLKDIEHTCLTYCTPDPTLHESLIINIKLIKKNANQLKKINKENYDTIFYNIVNLTFAIVSTLVGVRKVK